jgi:hypothetical protein
MNDAGSGFIRVGTLDELRDRRRGDRNARRRRPRCRRRRPRGCAHNRCPHIPLRRGSIEDGILTCHWWHHARFDLRSGSAFDLWADDVPLRAVRYRWRGVGGGRTCTARRGSALAPTPARRALPTTSASEPPPACSVSDGRLAF